MDEPGQADDRSADLGPDGGAGQRTPRWVKVFAVIAIVAVVLLLVLLLSGRGHGPGRHLGAASAPVSTAAGVVAGLHRA
jgi:hypothetical protein